PPVPWLSANQRKVVPLHSKETRSSSQEGRRATQEPVFSTAKASPLRTKGPRPPSAGRPSSDPLAGGMNEERSPETDPKSSARTTVVHSRRRLRSIQPCTSARWAG